MARLSRRRAEEGAEPRLEGGSRVRRKRGPWAGCPLCQRRVPSYHQRLEEGDDLVAEILAEGLEREAALGLHFRLHRLLALRL